MNDVPVQVLVAAFKDEDGASKALEELEKARKEKLIGIRDAAVIRKDANNKLHLRETGDMGGGKGAAIGGVLGGALGLLAGPIGWAALGGAALGGLAAKLRDGGFPDTRLRQLGEALQPGQSILVAVIEHIWVREVEQMMAEAGADVVTEELKADIAAELSSGNEVAYTALATADTLAVARVTTGGAPAAVEGAATPASDAPAAAEGAAMPAIDAPASGEAKPAPEAEKKEGSA